MKTLLLFFAGIAASTTAFAQPIVDTVTFMTPDTVVAWVVPPGNDSITVLLRGAQGGQYTSASTGAVLGQPGGYGLYRGARIQVSSGETLFLFIGGTGYTGLATGQSAFNGGGKNSANIYGTAGGGGGASDIRKGGKALSNRIFISGGGGGSSYNEVSTASFYYGGAALLDFGTDGSPASYGGGFGAFPTYGGRGGVNMGFDTGSRGSLGQGGDGGVGSGGGGGGGGYYGGGGGSLGGGGGNSSGPGIQAVPGVSPIVVPTSRIYSGRISIVYIKNGVGISGALSLFSEAAIVPNPSSNAAALTLTITRQTKVQIQLYDPTGKVVWNQAQSLAAGLNTIALPASELPAGLYLVRIKAEGGENDSTLKWIKE